MEITVGRASDPASEFIGRRSPLGNPYLMRDERDRDLVCDLYTVWLAHMIQRGDVLVMNELLRLTEIAVRRPLTLGCFCAPKRCHGDEIKQALDVMVKNYREEEL